MSRAFATVARVAATLCGSLWGDDDEFPFGPFRMYSGSRELNEPVADTQGFASVFYPFHLLTRLAITISFAPHLVAMAGFLPLERVRPLRWVLTRNHVRRDLPRPP